MLRAPAGTPTWGVEMMRQIDAEFLNRSKMPVKMPVYSKTDLPSAVEFKDCWIKVFDEAGGDTAAESDGVNWRRMQDRVIVS